MVDRAAAVFDVETGPVSDASEGEVIDRTNRVRSALRGLDGSINVAGRSSV